MDMADIQDMDHVIAQDTRVATNVTHATRDMDHTGGRGIAVTLTAPNATHVRDRATVTTQPTTDTTHVNSHAIADTTLV